MNHISESRIDTLAEACVGQMGDVFWDFQSDRDAEMGFNDPHRKAVSEVRNAMRLLRAEVEADTVYPSVLRAEYQTIVEESGDPDNDSALIRSLMADADWTRNGAQEVVRLAREYGTSILRNALALAEALDIADGARGL